MAMRSKTLRRMSPVARQMARLIGEQESIARRWKNLLPEIQRLEAAGEALKTAKQVIAPLPELGVAVINMFDELKEVSK